MAWQDELETDVKAILADNPLREVPVTRAEAILIMTMVDVLNTVPSWVEGTFDVSALDKCALARANDAIQRVLELKNLVT